MVEDLALLVEKLEQEKERAEVGTNILKFGICIFISTLILFIQRLEGQVNDITELHQHEVRLFV